MQLCHFYRPTGFRLSKIYKCPLKEGFREINLLFTVINSVFYIGMQKTLVIKDRSTYSSEQAASEPVKLNQKMASLGLKFGNLESIQKEEIRTLVKTQK